MALRVYQASAVPGVSSVAPVALHGNSRMARPALSFGDFPGLPCDPHRFRALFPALWSKFLRAHFRDEMHAAYSLGVTERSARDWWVGRTGANGSAALYAVAAVPGAMEWIHEEVRKCA